MSKTQKIRRRYTSEFKESVLKRLEPPTSDTVTSLSEELGVTRGTIYAWLRAKDNNSYTPKSTKRWTSEDKFHIVQRKDMADLVPGINVRHGYRKLLHHADRGTNGTGRNHEDRGIGPVYVLRQYAIRSFKHDQFLPESHFHGCHINGKNFRRH